VITGPASSKPANEVITGFLPEVPCPEQYPKRSSGASEAYRELIELELSRGRNAMGTAGSGRQARVYQWKRLTTELRRAGSGGRSTCSGTRCSRVCLIPAPACYCASI
jgi:hypothetical protein